MRELSRYDASAVVSGACGLHAGFQFNIAMWIGATVISSIATLSAIAVPYVGYKYASMLRQGSAAVTE